MEIINQFVKEIKIEEFNKIGEKKIKEGVVYGEINETFDYLRLGFPLFIDSVYQVINDKLAKEIEEQLKYNKIDEKEIVIWKIDNKIYLASENTKKIQKIIRELIKKII